MTFAFTLCISAGALTCRGDDDDPATETVHPDIVALLALLEIDVDIVRLVDDYFDYDGPRSGVGDIYLYTSATDHKALLLLDFYREPTDQQDLIEMSFTAAEEKFPAARALIRQFYDSLGTGEAAALEQLHAARSISDIKEAMRYGARYRNVTGERNLYINGTLYTPIAGKHYYLLPSDRPFDK